MSHQMTPDELRDLADAIEQESIVRKVGYLKEDLYNFSSDDSSGICFHQEWGDFWLKTKSERDALIAKFSSNFKKVLDKGTKFNCYFVDGKELWYDSVNYGVEEMSKEWAEKWLVDIQEVG